MQDKILVLLRCNGVFANFSKNSCSLCCIIQFIFCIFAVAKHRMGAALLQSCPLIWVVDECSQLGVTLGTAVVIDNTD